MDGADHQDERRDRAAVAVALVAGVLGAVQPKINAVLGERLDSSLLAAAVNFTAAFAVVVLALLVRPGTRRTVRRLRSWPVPRWTLTAGLGGALVVLAGAVAVETIGVAVFSVAFFAGQVTSGLLVDRLGVGPGGKRAAARARTSAAILAVAAVGLSQVGRPAGELAPLLVLCVFTAGAVSAFQSAFNARITKGVGDAVAATAVNVTLGLTALAAVTAGVAAGGHLHAPVWPAEPWLYVGGLLGVTIVLSLAVASAALGVLRATLAMLAAQLVTAFLVDWVAHDEAPTPQVLAGAALIVAAVVLVGRRRPAAPLSSRATPAAR